jgi:hypothetical protein
MMPMLPVTTATPAGVTSSIGDVVFDCSGRGVVPMMSKLVAK